MNTELRTYRLINLILAGVISLVFIYSGIFSYENANYPIPSFHNLMTGEQTLSTGLSRSFSAIVRFEFEIAHQFNSYGLRVFLFFFEQFFLRLIFFVLVTKATFCLQKTVIFDAAFSAILFTIHFYPFIIALFTDFQ